MLAFIRANYKNGDTILINCTVGAIEGKIAFVSQDSIVLRLPNNMIYGIAASDIRSFTAATPDAIITNDCPQAEEQKEDATTADNENLMSYANEALQAEGNEEQDHTTDKPTSIADVIGTKKENGHDEVLDSLGKEEPQVKVVGKISLEQLNRIDPKGAARRTSFQKNHENETEANDADEYGKESNYRQSAPYVPAMGRITYYNRDKRYGFIHDYKEDIDLYFHVHQVADSNLYERVNRGLKVVYTATEKPTGHVAVCVHFPNTVEKLLDKADEYIEKGYYDFANGIINHVLAVYPDNADALEMSQEVKDLVPAEKRESSFQKSYEKKANADDGILYKPDTLYTTAKRASIMHDYDKAEEYYIKAIEADERTVSSVKDLLQVFVMRFKSVDTDAERELWHDEAIKAYDKYKDLLPDDISTTQFLAGNFYLPLLDYNKYLELTEQLLAKPELAEDKAKRAFYLWQRALALHKDGRDPEALEECDRALEIVPYHSQSKSLKRVLLQALENQDEVGTEEGLSGQPTEDVAPAGTENGELNEDPSANEAPAPEEEAQETEEEETASEEEQTPDEEDASESADDNEGVKKPDSWWDELSNSKEY